MSRFKLKTNITCSKEILNAIRYWHKNSIYIEPKVLYDTYITVKPSNLDTPDTWNPSNWLWLLGKYFTKTKI